MNPQVKIIHDEFKQKGDKVKLLFEKYEQNFEFR